ncbi:MAG: Nif3-like dinuclear metal center hexameric protein [Verrucomicrobiales bacterium]|nr:Nif3-like dinuclear metal center hexameric protein [Verrucomicrobiales bacterium]
MATLNELADAANSWLKINEIPDYPQALNGVQLENSGEVKKIAVSVDACLPVIEEACAMGADLLVVHHGLFWQGAQKIEGPVYRKLKLAMEHDLAIYSAHIPLDVHPELGNNAQLIDSIGFGESAEPFFPWKGIELGLKSIAGLERDELVKKVEGATGSAAHLCPGGPERVELLGVITGGAGSEIAAIAETGIDTFITGEGPHWSYTAAEELGINLIYGGHYATETFGVKALAEKWVSEFDGLEWSFIEHPTGL